MQQSQITADGTALKSTEYLYEPDTFRPMAQVETNHQTDRERLHYIVTDHAGTPQELCSPTGEIEWRGDQALWGNYYQRTTKVNRGYREEAANDVIHCDLRYQGQLEDTESGLYYNLNRYYDADSGQYLSPDPIGMVGGMRPQGYVENPVGVVDPLGLTGTSHLDKETQAKKADNRRRYHSKSATYEKHTKAKTREDAISKSSGKKPSQYWDETQEEMTSKEVTAYRNKVEKEALQNGDYLPQSGTNDYYIYDSGRTVGYNEGKATQYMRVEVNKDMNEFHGHPISEAKYRQYMRKL